jgi:hypothetical protein
MNGRAGRIRLFFLLYRPTRSRSCWIVTFELLDPPRQILYTPDDATAPISRERESNKS